MAGRDAADEEAGMMGSGEQIEPDPEAQARRGTFERAARAGADEFAGVVEQNILGLAEEFEARMIAQLKQFGEEFSDALNPSERQRSQFVAGAIFGALVFAGGVLLGRRRD